MAKIENAEAAIEEIRKVRQARYFEDRPVPDDVLNELLEVARWSGSARNQQPWHFVVMTDKAQLKAISEVRESINWVAGAPLAIALVFNTNNPTVGYDEGRVTERILIAASLLGASRVDGVDIDPVSVRTARENVERNELPTVVDLKVGSVGPGEPFTGNQYDLVLANIIARILIELNEGIFAFVKPGGILVLSGIIEDRLQETIDTYAAYPLDLIDRGQEADWYSLVYRKRT